jgi:hypothetical protein
MLVRAILTICLLAAGACRSPGPEVAEPVADVVPAAFHSQPASPSPAVEALQLQSLPTVVNLDDRPGADGVQMRLYMFHPREPMAVALERGTVEFLLYEGRVRRAQLETSEPHHAWSFSAEQLRRFAAPSLIGVGYQLALGWGDNAPRTGIVTLSARLLRPGQRPLYAEPLSLAMGR